MKKLINLQKAVFQNFKPEHQDTLTKIAVDTYDGSRGNLFHAVQAARTALKETSNLLETHIG